MSQEPKRRHSKTRKRVRRASIILKSVATVVCKNCGKLALPHIACRQCGYYHGKTTGRNIATVTKA